MLIHWIWLSTRPGLSDRGRAALLEHFQDAEDIFFADSESLACVEFLSADAVVALQDKNLTEAQKILDDCARKHIQIVTYRDAAYPGRLRNIADPPVVLYYKGSLPQLDALPVIGVVGTRKASSYGRMAARRMGYQIATCGGIVVSGAASGIDGMAMAGALMANAPVVGVLGSGADVVYPPSNRGLFADVERSGCLLTEFPPGTPPYKWNFPKRNRIISGLSCGILVVEAPERSGALITARQAADQGRDVFVVPGNIDVPTCKGSNALLRDGAILAECGWDVLSEYKDLFPDKIRNDSSAASRAVRPYEAKPEKPMPQVAQKPKLLEKHKAEKSAQKKKEIDNSDSSLYIDAEEKLPALSADQEKIVALVRQGKTLVDDIIADSGLSAGAVLAALTMLELSGVITRLPGKRVELKKRSN